MTITKTNKKDYKKTKFVPKPKPIFISEELQARIDAYVDFWSDNWLY